MKFHRGDLTEKLFVTVGRTEVFADSSNEGARKLLEKSRYGEIKGSLLKNNNAGIRFLIWEEIQHAELFQSRDLRQLRDDVVFNFYIARNIDKQLAKFKRPGGYMGEKYTAKGSPKYILTSSSLEDVSMQTYRKSFPRVKLSHTNTVEKVIRESFPFVEWIIFDDGYTVYTPRGVFWRLGSFVKTDIGMAGFFDEYYNLHPEEGK